MSKVQFDLSIRKASNAFEFHGQIDERAGGFMNDMLSSMVEGLEANGFDCEVTTTFATTFKAGGSHG